VSKLKKRAADGLEADREGAAPQVAAGEVVISP